MASGLPGSGLIAGFGARLRSLAHGLRRRGDIEAEMREEFRHHLELRTSDLIRRGMSPQEAARQARIEFGHIESHKEDARASRGLGFFDQIRFSWLDVKLGLRMLAKYPGLSVVAVIGMTVAIAIGAAAFGAIYTTMDPTLPLHEGERVVSLQNTDSRNPGNPDRRAVHDFVDWRSELTSVQDLSAFTTASRNLVRPDGSTDLVQVAQMTPSGFRVARVAPFLGRPLVESDENEGAPPVVVISYEDWQRDFGADPEIVGRLIRLGSTLHTVVGVMPEGFRFPVNHRFWIPLRLDAADYERSAGPSIQMFGRLAPGATMEEAQAQLTTIGLQNAAAYPETHAHLRPRVLPYTHPFFDIDSPAMVMALHAIQLTISLLLVVVAVNVSILVYARTATRAGEIAVRSALGASRMRVVIQLFVEALVLSGTAAVLGLAIAAISIERIDDVLRPWGDQPPFWIDPGLSAGIVAYVVGLALLAAAIVGVLPALKATGRRVQAGLQQISSRGSQMQLGRTWTTLIILQVGLAVAVLPYALYIAGQSISRGTADAAYPADEILRAYLSMEHEEAPGTTDATAYAEAAEARFVARTEELLRRLEAEPSVIGVTFASHFPGGAWSGRIEVEGLGTKTVRINHVDPHLFTVFDVPVLAGRGFVEGDVRDDAAAVLVDRVLADNIAAGGDVLGRRVRHLRRSSEGDIEAGPWLEIVGIVPDFTIQDDVSPANPNLYQPTTLTGAYHAGFSDNISLAVRVRGSTAIAFAARLREITTTVDPTLQLQELQSAAVVQRMEQRILRFIALGVTAVTLSVLLLSAAGIYAMMSFTVARRRREIGIRSALGADARRVLSGIFARASAQLGAGVLGGLIIAVAIDRAAGFGPLRGGGLILLPIVALLMVSIGLLAALGPARRGLAVQPTEALREE